MRVNHLKSPGFLWAVAVVAAASVVAGGILGPRPAFTLLCHQLPNRSFVVDGHLFAVCHRCIGLYMGVLLGLVAGRIPIVGTWWRTWGFAFAAVAVTFVLADVTLDVIHVVSNSATSRFVSGLGLGAAGGVFLATLILFPASPTIESKGNPLPIG